MPGAGRKKKRSVVYTSALAVYNLIKVRAHFFLLLFFPFFSFGSFALIFSSLFLEDKQ